MDPIDTTPPVKRSNDVWILALCSLLAIAAALTLAAGLLAHQHPTWLVLGAGLGTFPVLPLLWHLLGDTRGKDRPSGFLSGRARFALRSLAVALVVLGVTLGNLGAKRVVSNLRDLTSLLHKPGPATPAELRPVTTPGPRHGLESFIPADATMVVGLAGSTAVEQLLAAQGITARAELSALATCQIDFANARILIATRAGGAQMIVVRATGLADERNLYCLVGVLGADQLQIRSEGQGMARTLRVSGFLARALTFRTLDPSTVIATNEAWKDTDGKLFATDGMTAQGRLGQPILRVDRGAPLWMASADETPQGVWDLALDFRQDGALLNLRGSATPPSGEADRAELSLRVPLAFVRTLPERSVSLGIRGIVTAALAANAGLSPTQAAPTPAHKDAGAL